MSTKAKIGIGSMLFLLVLPFAGCGHAPNHKLIQAAKQGDTEVVETLMAEGADVNAKDKDGFTALMQAAA